MPPDRAALIADLIRDEGEVLHAYQDSLGYWTIGVGHLIDKRLGGKIPQHISRALLDLDIDAAITALVALFPWFEGLDAVRQRAVVNLRFNLGPRLLEFTRFLAAMERSDFQAAADHLVASKWYTQVGARGPRVVRMVRTGQAA